ncbi:MAG: hypothetical protein LCH96_02430 [Actinobacteria bacterium]|nr:hypothetical protein [Actinomycetota bacterium]
MDVFEVRDKVIDDYRSFTTASIDIKDPRLKDYYQSELDRDRQWPEPWISLNPAFETGGRIDELVRDGLLHPECERIFRVKRHVDDPGRDSITLHRHQREGDCGPPTSQLRLRPWRRVRSASLKCPSAASTSD